MNYLHNLHYNIIPIFCLLLICSSCQDAAIKQSSTNQTKQLKEETTQLDHSTWSEVFKTLIQRLDSLPQDEPSTDYQKLKLLEQFMQEVPLFAPQLNLKRAEVLFSLGQAERAYKIAQSLWDNQTFLSTEAHYLVAEKSNQCRQVREAVSLLSSEDHSSARYLKVKLKLALYCNEGEQADKIERQIARLDPQSFSVPRLVHLFKGISPKQALNLALAWEKKRAPHLAQALLTSFLKTNSLTEEESWSFRYERERIQIERIRSGFVKSAKKIKRLTRAKKEKGRQASLLLGKAWSKANKFRQASVVYQELIKEWKHSSEAKTARFRLAFLHYEQGNYKTARKGFSELTRHKGDPKTLKRFSSRAKKGTLTHQAEWYFAWSLFQTSPRQAAPFLEAQIGEGLPLSSEGRRAAYWAAIAYSKQNPKKAAQLKADLLKGSWGDWYSLLLRGQDPSAVEDQKPWPRLPPLPAPIYMQITPGSSQKEPRPSLQPLAQQLPRQLQSELETLAIQRQLAIILNQDSLLLTLDLESKKQLSRLQTHSEQILPWLVELEQFRLAQQWMISSNPQLLKEVPTLEKQTWWRNVYPLAYQAATYRASQISQISQETLLSFIYKESAFMPRAISHAYAMGLMQLLEKTAQALHPQQPLPNLLDPNTNIQLGAEYLAALSSRYHQQLPLIAAAYNAGPINLNRWLQKGPNKLDLFVELIPYREGREYVKRLVSIYCTYMYLYGQKSINTCATELPLTLNLSIKPGINF